MRIGIDIDDVLADFVGEFLRVAERTHGKKFAPPTDWSMASLGLPPEELAKVWENLRAKENFWQGLSPSPGMEVSRLRRLCEVNEVYFITSRRATAGRPVVFQSIEWLRSLLCIAYPTVLVSTVKGQLAAALNLEFFADDCIVHCEAVLAASPTTKVFLIAAAHNRDYTHPKIVRLRDANEFFDILEQARS